MNNDNDKLVDAAVNYLTSPLYFWLDSYPKEAAAYPKQKAEYEDAVRRIQNDEEIELPPKPTEPEKLSFDKAQVDAYGQALRKQITDGLERNGTISFSCDYFPQGALRNCLEEAFGKNYPSNVYPDKFNLEIDGENGVILERGHYMHNYQVIFARDDATLGNYIHLSTYQPHITGEQLKRLRPEVSPDELGEYITKHPEVSEHTPPADQLSSPATEQPAVDDPTKKRQHG